MISGMSIEDVLETAVERCRVLPLSVLRQEHLMARRADPVGALYSQSVPGRIGHCDAFVCADHLLPPWLDDTLTHAQMRLASLLGLM
mmetsp:Transcript_64842/g.107809  ORF Transcript_64842/g.107809 Transcript_64842/m.107809 type:complete len:87 (+) Transcript_64842:3-263(+)